MNPHTILSDLREAADNLVQCARKHIHTPHHKHVVSTSENTADQLHPRRALCSIIFRPSRLDEISRAVAKHRCSAAAECCQDELLQAAALRRFLRTCGALERQKLSMKPGLEHLKIAARPVANAPGAHLRGPCMVEHDRIESLNDLLADRGH